jgi:hypothetical protein
MIARVIHPFAKILAALILAGIGYGFYLYEASPCGRFDANSKCISSVKLDVAATGIDPTLAKADYKSFDIGPGGGVLIVGLTSKAKKVSRSVLAVFDAANGKMIRVLRDLESKPGNRVAHTHLDQTAFSPDGTLVASLGFAMGDVEHENSLVVYRVSDGLIERVVVSRNSDRRQDCTGMLDFSPDNSKLQCGSIVYDLTTGATEDITIDGNYKFPMYADYSGTFARATTGTRVEPNGRSITVKPVNAAPMEIASPQALQNRLEIPAISPNAQRFYVLRRAERNAGAGLQLPFRQRSEVGLYNLKNGTVVRQFSSQERYVSDAWSRDSLYFGFLGSEMTATVFKVEQ